MQDILQHINGVEGVLGSAVVSKSGELLEHTFPALIDVATLNRAAGLILDCAHGLQASESLDLLDMRYNEGRIIIKSFSGAMLCLLCAKSINLQMITITLNLAAKKLESILLSRQAAAETAPDAPQKPEKPQGETILRLAVTHLANREASSSFDSLGMIALSQHTAKYISSFYKTPFRKLTLTNNAVGTSGTFPIMVMNDMDTQYDGAIIVGPGIEKKLKVNAGDRVAVTVG